MLDCVLLFRPHALAWVFIMERMVEKFTPTAKIFVLMKLWGKRLSECLERRERVTFANSNLNNAQAFTRIKDAYLRTKGIHLKTEAKYQIEYTSYMANLGKCLKEKSYPTAGEKSVPGIRILFNEAAILCEKNPEFQSSLIVAFVQSYCLQGKVWF